jgi:hypothetical protein
MKLPSFALVIWMAVVSVSTTAETLQAAMERIVVTSDGKGFETAESRQRFVPWGANYGNGGRLMEDYWNTNWDTLVSDFRKLHEMGANVARVHLQFGKFMVAPDRANTAALKQLSGLLKLAESDKIYLDVTGLGCYRPADTPAWYDSFADKGRRAAQANFWSAVAKACKGSPAVFCYDLINEPLSPGDKRKPGQWRSGSLYGEYDFLQCIALDPAGRKREDIAAAWIEQMTHAIRKQDRAALITVGLLPWSREWKHLSGFLPEAVAPKLDFLSVHIYPDSKKLDESIECLRQVAVGKPVIVEETFPLSCTAAELETFMRASRQYACGWLGHYDGQSLAEMDALQESGKLTPPQSVYRAWWKLFERLRPEFAQ